MVTSTPENEPKPASVDDPVTHATVRVPNPLNSAVSARLSRMPVRNTKPELALRRELHRLGLRFTLHDQTLPGRPDICLTRAKVAVFVDGCFWHGCPEHGTVPKNNREWWTVKLERTRLRDRHKDEALAARGYEVVHVWEHESPGSAAALIERIWRDRTGRQRGSPTHA